MSLYCRDCFHYGPKTSKCYCEDSFYFRTFRDPTKSVTCDKYKSEESVSISSCDDCAYCEHVFRECETIDYCLKRHKTDGKMIRCGNYISTKDYCNYLGIHTEEEDMLTIKGEENKYMGDLSKLEDSLQKANKKQLEAAYEIGYNDGKKDGSDVTNNKLVFLPYDEDYYIVSGVFSIEKVNKLRKILDEAGKIAYEIHDIGRLNNE